MNRKYALRKDRTRKGFTTLTISILCTTKSRFGLDHSTELLLSIWATICIGLIGVRKTAELTAPKKADD